MPNQNNIYISAGESSGDLLGADLARALLQKNPQLQLTGMGGERMREAGVDLVFDAHAFSVIGVTEVIRHLPRILKTLRAIKKYLTDNKPSLIILIDFPDTHFRIMAMAKKLNIPVLYYVSPQIWAWRAGRIKQIQHAVDHMAVLFSFEEKIYRDANVPVTFVGHPLSQLAKATRSKEEAFAYFQLEKNRPTVALFPGSRHSEMENHLPVILKAAEEISNQIANAQFVLVLAKHFNRADIQNRLPKSITVIQDSLYDLLSITDAAIAVSGTVTLEIALMQTPLCIIYKASPLSFWIVKQLVKIKQIGLCNIVAEKSIAKELIQTDAQPEAIAQEIVKILSDEDYRENMRTEFGELRDKISIQDKSSSEKVADIAMGLRRA